MKSTPASAVTLCLLEAEFIERQKDIESCKGETIDLEHLPHSVGSSLLRALM